MGYLLIVVMCHKKQSWLIALIALAFVAGVARSLAQMQMIAEDDTDKNATNKTPGFSVKKEQQPVADSIEDFERFRDKKAWEKAFTAIGKIADGEPGRLVADRSGFYVPTHRKIQAELLALPPDGREAYRLFNDAKAAQLLHDATQFSPTAAVDEVQLLKKIVDRYFITSVGDRAADRLGDVLFESGDFANAERCWRLIIDNYPDTSLPVVLLQTKRAIALARGGDWAQFDALSSTIKDRYAGQTARIGGRDVVVTDLLQSLKPNAPTASISADSSASTFTANHPDDSNFTLPSNETPVWQIPLMDSDAVEMLTNQLNQNGWGAMAGQFEQMLPATAVDDRRIYVNWLGVCFAADLKTGKMLWRTDSFGDMTQKMQQTIMQGQMIDPAVYTATMAGDKVLFTRRSSDMRNWNDLPITRLMCLHGDTGKSVWRSETGKLSEWGFCGSPLIGETDIYCVAHPLSSSEMFLLCIGLEKGDLRWKVSLGTPAASTDYRGVPSIPQPTLLKHLDKVDVLTNNGALIEVDVPTRQIDWAFSYPTTVETQRYFYGYQTASPPVAPGAMLVSGSTLYFKEYKNNLLFALDLSGPAVKWKRPIDPDNAVAHFDGRNLFLVGTEAQCVDGDSRAMQWADKLSIGTGSIGPLLQGDHLYVFGRRGIHEISLTDGDSSLRFRGYDRDSSGGTLWKTTDRLVTVSNHAVTAYAR